MRTWLMCATVGLSACGPQADAAGAGLDGGAAFETPSAGYALSEALRELADPEGAAAGELSLPESLPDASHVVLPAAACEVATKPLALAGSYDGAHVRLRFPVGSAAEHDRVELAHQRDAAYERIASTLGIHAKPRIEAVLSPERAVAVASGLGTGVADASRDRYEAVYNGEPGSFERVRAGHHVARLLLAERVRERVGQRHYPLPLLATGVAELLDQAERDRHGEFAVAALIDSLRGGNVLEINARDVNGQRAGFAGSLAQAIVDRHGMKGLLAVVDASALHWEAGCARSGNLVCVADAADVRELLNASIKRAVGGDFDALLLGWERTLLARVGAGLPQVSEGTRHAALETLAVLSSAANTAQYRSGMESFYCDHGGEERRAAIARKITASPRANHTALVGMWSSGVVNFPEAIALLRVQESNGATLLHWASLERFPEGWRMTWSDQWD